MEWRIEIDFDDNTDVFWPSGPFVTMYFNKESPHLHQKCGINQVVPVKALRCKLLTYSQSFPNHL